MVVNLRERPMENFTKVHFHHFPSFVNFSNEARIACGPGMIRAYEGAKDKNQKSSLTPSAKNFAMSVTPDTIKKPYCNVCAGEHKTVECSLFLKMNIEERRSTAKKKGLCYKCLRKGHLVTDCRREGPSLLFFNIPSETKK